MNRKKSTKPEPGSAEQLALLTPKVMGAFHDMRQPYSEGGQLTMRQYQALIIIGAKGSLTITELCEKLNLAASTGTELINRMISAGYVEKSVESKDRRHMAVSIGDKGKELLRERHEALTKMFEKFMLPFSEKERLEFVAAFERIWSIISRHYAKPIRPPASKS